MTGKALYPDPQNIVRLVVNGQEFGGWKSVRISAGIERQARDFDLEVTDHWPGQTDVPRRIRPFDACQVYIGADLVLTGYVDGTPIKYDGRSVSVGVKGRSKTADLVDCCPPDTPSAGGVAAALWGDVKGPDGKTANVIKAPAKSSAQWRGLKMEVIAAALASFYNVRVIAEVDTGKVIPEHQVQVGETVFESIDRMMRLRHVLSTDNEFGDLVFIEVGSGGRAVTALEVGENIRSGSTDLDYKGVFSEYVCKGQRAGNDDEHGEAVAEEEGSASDEDDETGSTGSATSASGETAITQDSRSKRRRVLVIKQSGHADEGTCTDRAAYERAHRAAKALQTVYTVAGWRQHGGQLWKPNQLVRVRDGIIGFDAEMVIAECSYILDKEGQRTEIKVGPPDGYVTKAGKLKKSQKGGGPSWSDVK